MCKQTSPKTTWAPLLRPLCRDLIFLKGFRVLDPQSKHKHKLCSCASDLPLSAGSHRSSRAFQVLSKSPPTPSAPLQYQTAMPPSHQSLKLPKISSGTLGYKMLQVQALFLKKSTSFAAKSQGQKEVITMDINESTK